MRISCACTFVARAHSHMRVSDWFIIARRLPRASAPSLLPSGRGNFYFFFYTSHTRVDAFAYVPLCARVHNHSHMRASWHARVPHAVRTRACAPMCLCLPCAHVRTHTHAYACAHHGTHARARAHGTYIRARTAQTRAHHGTRARAHGTHARAHGTHTCTPQHTRARARHTRARDEHITRARRTHVRAHTSASAHGHTSARAVVTAVVTMQP